jgi:hypothetical protein
MAAAYDDAKRHEQTRTRRLRILGSDGEWTTPHEPPTAGNAARHGSPAGQPPLFEVVAGPEPGQEIPVRLLTGDARVAVPGPDPAARML